MYDLLEFLWTIPSYRPCIDTLAQEVYICGIAFSADLELFIHACYVYTAGVWIFRDTSLSEIHQHDNQWCHSAAGWRTGGIGKSKCILPVPCKLVVFFFGTQNLAKVKQIEDLMASPGWADMPDQDKKDVSSLVKSLWHISRSHCLRTNTDLLRRDWWPEIDVCWPKRRWRH